MFLLLTLSILLTVDYKQVNVSWIVQSSKKHVVHVDIHKNFQGFDNHIIVSFKPHSRSMFRFYNTWKHQITRDYRKETLAALATNRLRRNIISHFCSANYLTFTCSKLTIETLEKM